MQSTPYKEVADEALTQTTYLGQPDQNVLWYVFAMTSNPATLPDDPVQLKQLLVERQAHSKTQTDILIEEIRHLRAQLFGRKSDKPLVDNGSQPLPLFDRPEPAVKPDEVEEIQVPDHSRKKKGRRPLPEDLSRFEQIHVIDPADKICGCGCELSRIGEEISEQFDIIPAKMQMIRHIRPQNACPNCQGMEDSGPTLKIAPVPAQLIPKSIATPGLLAHLLTGRFVDESDSKSS